MIAEFGLTHEGSLGNACAMVTAAAAAGADAVKFQHHVFGESTNLHAFRVPAPQDLTRNDYWQRTSFSVAQWESLIEFAHTRQVDIGITPFSLAGFEEIKHLGWDFFKIGSGEWDRTDLLNAIRSTGLQVYQSLGLSPPSALGLSPPSTPQWISNPEWVLMLCCSDYPASDPRRITIDRRYGLSDHSGKIWPAIKAIAVGSPAVEVHVCFHRDQFGPDVGSSITFQELSQLVEFERFNKILGTDPVTDKEKQAQYAEYARCKQRTL